MNVFARFVGVLFSPRQTFENVVAQPRVLGMLVLVGLLSAVLTTAFFATPVGKDAFLDMMVTRAGDNVTDQQVQAFEKMAAFAPLFGVGTLIGIPIYILIVATVLFVIFNVMTGGNASFKQVFAIVTHAWVVLAVSALFTLPLSYARGTMASATNVAVLLPMIDESSFLGHFLGSIDFFVIWACIVLAIGLAVLYRRKTQSIATSLFVLYGVIALIIAFVKS